jgi:SAM-dependent methyltransferase
VEASLKSSLRALVLEIRQELEGSYDNAGGWKPGDLEKRLASIGVTRDRSVPADELAQVPPEDREARRVIDAFVESRTEAKVGRADAVGEFIQEAAYTWANRLLALRSMEARGFIDEVILQKESYGGRSLQHYRLSRKKPARCAGEDGGLFSTLFDEFERRARDLPMLFNPKAAAVALRPSVAVLKRCITLLSGTEAPKGQNVATDVLFTAPDALGWAYQYWNTEEKKRVDEWLKTKEGFKCEGRDIVPKTCLYTEDYMVKFLVQNSLGALWMQMHPESKLSEGWAYYVRDADRVASARKPVTEITFLDPACGSGHFLIEAFDLLYAMYEEVGELTKPAEICAAILERNLYGVDIDERAVQIAALALAMKAWEKARDFAPRRVNLVATNFAFGSGSGRLDIFLKNHPEDAPLKPAIVAIFDALAHADELGSLLQVDEQVEKELRYLREKYGAQTTIFGKESAGDLATWKASVIERLRADFNVEFEAADLSTVFFGEAGVKGLSLLDLLGRRYDVVAANPPYMGSKHMGGVVKDYVQKHFSAGRRDLFAAFILRCRELARDGGRVAMVTQQAWMFLQSYADLRALSDEDRKSAPRHFGGVLRDTTIELLAHLGPRAFTEISGEVVNTALFVLSRFVPEENHTLTAFRLVGLETPEEKAVVLRADTSSSKTVISRLYQRSFLRLPGCPIIYWFKEDLFQLLSSQHRLHDLADLRQGMATADNARFLRYWWETSPDRDSRPIYAKGGGYQKWYGLELLTFDYRNAGENFRCYEESKYSGGQWKGILGRKFALVQRYVSVPGVVYSQMAAGSLGPRLWDGGFFDVKSIAVFPLSSGEDLNRFEIAGLLSTHYTSFILRALTQNQEFHAGYTEQLPVPDKQIWTAIVDRLARVAFGIKRRLVQSDCIDRGFHLKDLSEPSARGLQRVESDRYAVEAILHLIEGRINRVVTDAASFSAETELQMITETGRPAAWYPLVKGYDQAVFLSEDFAQDREDFAEADANDRIELTSEELAALKVRLRSYYVLGRGIKLAENEAADQVTPEDEDERETLTPGARIPIPAETFLEELSQALEVHPVSVYWLLRELREKDGVVCLSELCRFIEDYFSVMVLRMLGHRWPREIEAGDAAPHWAETSGIILLTAGTNGQPLIDRVRDRIAADFGSERVGAIEREFEEIMGKPLAGWLDSDFFKHHISQFRKRPIAWQLQSEPPSRSAASGKGKNGRKLTRRGAPLFSCLIYYHRLGDGLLETVRVAHIGPLRKSLQTEHSGLSGMKTRTPDQDARRAELEIQIEELSEFDQRLEASIEQGFMSPALEKIADKETIDKWTSRDGKAPPPATRDAFIAQERRYHPDVNDGVRVNIAPLQKAGLLAADVIATKDLGKAISDRAEWRADERSWCREGKLPHPGWWET